MISKSINLLRGFCLLLVVQLIAVAGFSQSHVTFTLTNATATANTLTFDIYIVNDGTTALKASALSMGVNYSPLILNGGTPAAGAFVYQAGTRASEFATLTAYTTAHVLARNHLRVTTNSVNEANSVTLPSNQQMMLGRFTFTNTTNWTPNSNPNLAMQLVTAGGYTQFAVNVYVDGNTTTPISLATTGPLPTGNRNGVVNANITLNPVATCAVTGSATTTPATCAGGTGSATITLAGSGSENLPGSYSLDGGAPVAFSTNPFTISGLSAGAHSVVTTTGTCTSDPINFAITAPATFTATYVKTNKSACAGVPDGSITVTATGGSGSYNYAWSGAVGSNNPTPAPYPNPGNVSAVTGLEYGYYQVIVTDANGCGSVTLSDIHIQNAYLPYVTYNPSTSATCAPTGSVTGYAQAAVGPYTWQLDGGNSQPSNVFTNVGGGSHTLTATDARGCSSTISVTVPTAAALGINPYVVNASSCNNDGSIKINRVGGIPPYDYSMDGSPFVTNNLFTGLAAGPHTAVIRDSKGCTATMTVNVGQGAGLTVTASKVNTSSCVNDGSIQVNASGGIPPYMYTLNGGTPQSSNSFAGLGAGNYVVKATDSRGCFNTLNVTIVVNNIVVTYIKQDAPNCAGTGWIKLLRTGGVNPYTYSLDGNNYTSQNYFPNVAPGTYTGYVKDAKTCVGSTATNEIVILPEGCSVGRTVAPVAQEVAASVTAYPNPSVTDFSLRLTGFNMNDKVTVTVTDLYGRKVYQTQGTGKQVYSFGKTFIAGMYTVNIAQGDKQFSVKLVKE
jgi:hypothetical protein